MRVVCSIRMELALAVMSATVGTYARVCMCVCESVSSAVPSHQPHNSLSPATAPSTCSTAYCLDTRRAVEERRAETVERSGGGRGRR